MIELNYGIIIHNDYVFGGISVGIVIGIESFGGIPDDFHFGFDTDSGSETDTVSDF